MADRKQLIMNTHRAFIKSKQYRKATMLLSLLINGRVALGLDDESCEVEMFLEDLGCPYHYTRSYSTAVFHI